MCLVSSVDVTGHQKLSVKLLEREVAKASVSRVFFINIYIKVLFFLSLGFLLQQIDIRRGMGGKGGYCD